MSSPKFMRPAPQGVATPTRGVGRLLPVEGITVRPHPDRVTLHRFLQELRLPIATIDAFLDLVPVQGLPEPVREAFAAIAENARYLGDLVGDYAEFSRLEADQVKARPSCTSPLAWLDSMLAPHVAGAAELGVRIVVVQRSFLPSAVEFDADLAAQALGAMLRTAIHRALPGEMQLRVSYHSGGGAGTATPARLCFEAVTLGGGFQELDQGYVFAAFETTDAAQRPVLGLSVGHRLAVLLGGELSIESPGARSCSYRISFLAPPAPGACWIDPMVGPDHRLGVICPGLVLFTEVGTDNQLLCGNVLRRAGYAVEFLPGIEDLLARLATAPMAHVSIVLDAGLPGVDLTLLVADLRQRGCTGCIVLFAPAELSQVPPGCDAVLRAPIVGAELVEVLAHHFAHNEVRNATRLR
jgi:CheY-like chemotaxis protein